MSKIAVYNLAGEAVSEQEAVITVEKENPVLFTQVVLAGLANRRRAIANTKNRGEVSGGGRKPFKQKGTGNARAGSTRSPLWIGGGVTFGPRRNRNFSKRLPQTMLQTALKMALTDKINAKHLIILDELKMDQISTKKIQGILEKLPIEEGKILVILPQLDVNVELSFANIPYAKVIKSGNLNILDLSRYDYILTTVAAWQNIVKILTVKMPVKKVVTKSAVKAAK